MLPGKWNHVPLRASSETTNGCCRHNPSITHSSCSCEKAAPSEQDRFDPFPLSFKVGSQPSCSKILSPIPKTLDPTILRRPRKSPEALRILSSPRGCWQTLSRKFTGFRVWGDRLGCRLGEFREEKREPDIETKRIQNKVLMALDKKSFST